MKYCGRNEYGQLGIGSRDKDCCSFVCVSLENVVQVACGRHHMMSLTGTFILTCN